MIGRRLPTVIGMLTVSVGAVWGAFDAASGLYPPDLSVLGAAADTLLSAHWSSAFSSPDVQVGPLHLFGLGLTRALARSLDLSYRSVLAIVVQGGTAFGILVTVRRVVGRRILWLETAAALAALAGGVGWTAYISGHPEELAVGLLWIWAGTNAARGRGWQAGVMLAAAAALKLSGVLGLPLLLLAPAAGARRSGLAAFVGGCALAYAPFLAFGGVQTFGYSWTPTSSLWSVLLDGGSFPWWLRFVQGGVTIAAGAAAAMWLKGTAAAGWATALALVTVRIALDPQPHHYFWLTFEGAAIVGSATILADSRQWWGWVAALSAYGVMLARYLTFVPGFVARVVAGVTLVALARTRTVIAPLDPAPAGGLRSGGEEPVARSGGSVESL